MENCRPEQIQQRRQDRHMSLDMSSCHRDSGLSYLVSRWDSRLCVPHGFTIIPHFVCAVFQFFPALLIRHNVNCRCSTHGSCGYASHKDIGCHKLQRKQHSNLPDDVFITDVGECAGYAICILSRTQIKVSGVPLTKNDALGRLNASRVPAMKSGWEYLVLRDLQAYSDDQRQIPDIGSRKPRIIADPMVSKLFCISILSNCDWIAPLSAGVCSDICDVSAHADNEMQRVVTVSSFFIFLCLPPHFDTNKLGSLCKYFTRVRLCGVALPHSEFPKDLRCGTQGSSSNDVIREVRTLKCF